MISAEAWWNILSDYNEFIMPFQFIWMGFTLILTILFLIKPRKLTNILLKLYFIFSFAFIAIVFFAIRGQELPAFISQTICFGTLAILLVIDLKLNKFQFSVPEKMESKIIMMISLALVFLYPVLGLAIGHSYPKLIFLGSFPCPTTALAIVFATASLSKLKLEWQSIGLYATWILLLIWAIPFPIAIQIPQFGAFEDVIMLLIGVYGLSALIWSIIDKSRQIRKEKLLIKSEEIITEN